MDCICDDFQSPQMYQTLHFIGIQSYHYSLTGNLNYEGFNYPKLRVDQKYSTKDYYLNNPSDFRPLLFRKIKYLCPLSFLSI